MLLLCQSESSKNAHYLSSHQKSNDLPKKEILENETKMILYVVKQ